ncbi:MAG: histidine phosphatase family protein [Kiloniellaceae bacterium]
MRGFFFCLLLACTLLAARSGPAVAADFDLSKLKDGGYVVLLRHVKAGGADSDDFDLKDCQTQRQVGAPGRAQAAVLAERFRAAGIAAATVLSSQFCRAKQTAALLGLGPVIEEPALNYFHWKLGGEDEMNAAVRGLFAAMASPDGPRVLVTHSHAFVALGQEKPPSGGGLVLRPNGTASPDVVGTIAAPE